MTRQKSFKRLVRTRMEKTGESYTAARAMLLSAGGATGTAKPVLATSDQTIRRRTGRGWEEWFDLLDEWGAPDRTRRETARWVAELQEIEPLAWNAQAVVGSEAFVEASVRERWLPGTRMRERTATKPKSARFDWGDGSSRVNVTFLEKGEAKSTVALEHSRLADSEDRDRMKAWWRERLTALKTGLEGGELDT